MGARFTSERPAWKSGAGLFALALLFVLGLALAQRNGLLDGLNLGAMRAAGRAREAGAGLWLTSVMQAASVIGDTGGRLLLLGLGVAVLLWRSRPGAARWLALTMAGGTLLNLALKQVFAAPRPDLLPHLDVVHSYSFPSGHAAGNMIFFGALAMLAGRRTAFGLAALIIALIGISRVWLGVHWPSDVLAGWVEGLGWLALCRVWLPARGGEQERARQAMLRRHAVSGDEAVHPEAVEGASGRDQ